jgi:hypothetical protein
MVYLSDLAVKKSIVVGLLWQERKDANMDGMSSYDMVFN